MVKAKTACRWTMGWRSGRLKRRRKGWREGWRGLACPRIRARTGGTLENPQAPAPVERVKTNNFSPLSFVEGQTSKMGFRWITNFLERLVWGRRHAPTINVGVTSHVRYDFHDHLKISTISLRVSTSPLRFRMIFHSGAHGKKGSVPRQVAF